jgi:hypothetical protein
MPELTSQDRDSYQQLYDAAQKLQGSLLSDLLKDVSNLSTLKDLTSTFSTNLLKPAKIASFGQLQSQVELTGGYLSMYRLFTVAINSITESSQKANINKHHQELLMQYNQLKLSMEAVDDDFLDNVTTPCSDPLFLRFLKDKKVRTWTQQLMSDQAPALTDSEVEKLINVWGTAVTKFVEDARKEGNLVDPGKTETIAHFFCIHEQLEGLYSELSTSVALNS